MTALKYCNNHPDPDENDMDKQRAELQRLAAKITVKYLPWDDDNRALFEAPARRAATPTTDTEK